MPSVMETVIHGTLWNTNMIVYSCTIVSDYFQSAMLSALLNVLCQLVFLSAGCLLHMWCHHWFFNMIVYSEDSLLIWSVCHPSWWTGMASILSVGSFRLSASWLSWGLSGLADTNVHPGIMHLLWHFLCLRGTLCTSYWASLRSSLCSLWLEVAIAFFHILVSGWWSVSTVIDFPNV